MAIDKGVQKTLIIVGGILVALLLVFSFVNNSVNARTISSTGTSTIDVLPDFVTVYFSVDTKGTTAKEASDKNSKIVDDMKFALVASGVEEEQIKTQSFNVYPNYDYRSGSGVITGYNAQHSLKVEIDVSEKEKLGSVIDGGVGAGAGISYINYELNEENQKKYKIDAIKTATEDARTKAEALAEGSGSSLGSLVSISTSEWGYVPWLAADSASVMEKSGAEIQTSINPSEQEVSATVVAVFRIR
ncbi:MAG: SIMPL domain-containing protein [Candidatus Pacearchaeota archaeon]